MTTSLSALRPLQRIVQGIEALAPNQRLTFRRVETEEDILKFQHEYWKRDGVRFPLEYLRSGSPFFAFNSSGEIVGGFTVVSGSGLRAIEQLPETTKTRFMNSLKPGEVPVEVTAVWLQINKNQLGAAASFWMKVFSETFDNDKAVTVFACDLRKPGLIRLYESIASGVLYCGPIVQLPGMEDNGADEEFVFFGRVSDVLKGLYRQFFRRLIKAPIAKKAPNCGFRPERQAIV